MVAMFSSRPSGRARIPGRLNPDAWAVLFGAIAVEAGAAIMDIHRRGVDAASKQDGSPVTEADIAAERIILERLKELAPRWPVIAEEECAAGRVPAAGSTFILVDPLDGTREFLARNGEFTVNIALVHEGVPAAGAVFAPALDTLWVGGDTAAAIRITPGMPLAGACESRALAVRPAPPKLTAMASRSHRDAETDALIARLPVETCLSAGSSLKFCRIAEGAADVYPRFGRTMEWDTAAGHAVLKAAGGTMLTPEGEPFVYGKAAEGWCNGAFVALGDPSLARLFA